MLHPLNNIYPKWLSNRAMLVYVIALILVSLIYSSFALPWYYWLGGLASVLAFFYFSRRLTRQWSPERLSSERLFERRLFGWSLGLRLAWMLLIYYLFQKNYGNPFGFEDLDATFYDELGKFSAALFREGDFLIKSDIERWGGRIDISDMGYGYYMGLIYWLTNNNILLFRLLKCVLSAWTVVCVYRLAKRNFGERVGRMSAVFCMLWPNFWYYCGAHLKETEMVFLAVLFVEQADQMLRTRNFSVWKVLPLLLISGALFTIRTPLAIVTILCLLFSIFMSSSRIIGWSKRIIIGVLAVGLIGLTMGNRIAEEAKGLVENVQSGQQKKDMEWRSGRGGEKEANQRYAKYAGTVVFAPMIFTIPFPTMVTFGEGESVQNVQQLLNGGNFVKNILSFFCLFSMFFLLFSGQWREHLVPISYMLGYLVVLALSNFAQSERFHQPAMPMELMFAAYGLSLVLQGVPLRPGLGSLIKYKQWFLYWAILMFVACLAWNWFKLAGRGLA